MKTLELRKQLLILESDINRAQLAGDVAALRTGFHHRIHSGTTFGAIATSAVVLAADLAAISNSRHAIADEKATRLQSILKGAALVSTIWLALLAQKDQKKLPS